MTKEIEKEPSKLGQSHLSQARLSQSRLSQSDARADNILDNSLLVLSDPSCNRQVLSLQEHCLPECKVPKTHLEHHVIGINMHRAIDCEIKVDGYSRRFQVLSSEMNFVPAQHTFEAQWNREINSVVLNLSTALLSRNAIALWGSDQFELLPSLQVKDSFITQIALAVKQELTHSDANRMYIDTMANSLAVYLLRKFSTKLCKKPPLKGALSHQSLIAVLDYIDLHLELTLTVENLAAVASLSQYHFSRAFKLSMGLSPHQYIIQQRVERAKKLLSLKKMEIHEVAIACGFNSQSHLNRHFKRMTGLTPKGFWSL